MWLPKTEKEIIDAVKSGGLSESSIFDAKKEISTKSQEIAKDIASMANDGGVIIYGIGEDKNKRLTILNPIPLTGQPERIDAIVRSCIAEPLQIQITKIPTTNDPSIGYLVVLIPPSERAPHMVIVNGDHRFYGRTATGNAPLNEGEVARLYTRREKTESNRELLLENEIKSSPLEPNSNFVYLYLFSKPVFSKENLLDNIPKGGKNLQTILTELVIQVCNGKIFKRNSFSPDFNPPPFWKQLADGFIGQMGIGSSNLERLPASTLNIKIDFNGHCHLFCGRAGDSQNNQKVIFTDIVAGLTIRFVSLAANLYELSGYTGMVDLGIALTGLKESVVYTQDWRLESSRMPYDQDNFKRTGRFSNQIILANLQQTSEYLTNPFVNAISQGYINPYK